MTSIIVRTALLINTTSRLTRDTPIDKSSDSKSTSQRTSDVATNNLPQLPKPDQSVSSGGRGGSELHYYRQLHRTNREQRELSGAFRARL